MFVAYETGDANTLVFEISDSLGRKMFGVSIPWTWITETSNGPILT